MLKRRRRRRLHSGSGARFGGLTREVAGTPYGAERYGYRRGLDGIEMVDDVAAYDWATKDQDAAL